MTTVTVWILGDQLMPDHPAISAAEAAHPADTITILMIRSRDRLRQRPYQRKKLVLLLSAMRHYAEDLRRRGFTVDERTADSFFAGVEEHIAEHRPTSFFQMEAAEWDTRAFQCTIEAAVGIPVTTLPNTQFLIGQWNPVANPTGKRVIMENFYRAMRRHHAVLMDPDGTPSGGAWNFDAENRKRLPKSVQVPPYPTFPPDAITQQAMEDVEALDGGIGTVEGFAEPVTRAEALAAFADFLVHRLPTFGPYEDAMSLAHDTLFHSRLSAAMNIGLLEPLEMVRAAEAEYRAGRAPIASVEGFIRQILGWREFIAWQYWQQMPGLRTANDWDHPAPLPAFFWTAETDMQCLSTVIRRVLDTGYSHHIERLMILCNFAMLAGVRPSDVADWFLETYIDAYDWVVLPNVIGMGLNADGGQTATKPYICSANYISTMSDYCQSCTYNAKARLGDDACPINTLYWDFLIRNEQRLRANPRSGPAVLGLAKLSGEERGAINSRAQGLRAQWSNSASRNPS